jgi:hypothetical protein
MSRRYAAQMRFGKKKVVERLFDPAKVDVCAISEGHGQDVELFIVQDRPWTGSDAQLQSLQDKVQTYVSYAMDGQMVAAYPETVGLKWRIVIHTQTGSPDVRTQTVLDALNPRLTGYGGSIETRAGAAT